MRLTLAMAVACLGIVGISTADPARASIKQHTEIPAQGLGPALTALAKEFDFQVLYRTEVVGTLRTQGASGAMTAAEALEHVLSGTGLTYKYLDDKTVTILPVGSAAPSSSSEDTKQGNRNQGGDQKKSFWDQFRLAQATPANSGLGRQSSDLSATSAESGIQTGSEVRKQQQPTALDEVIVTAQKREERLQDVPVAVTALDAATLSERGQNRLQDYFATVPGLSVAPTAQGGQQAIAIRGVTTGTGTNPTVGVTIDDVPYGSSTLLGYGSLVFPDIDPGNLERIEVLRGPQGTLYGASSIGGLIKFVTKEPSTEGFSGRVQVLGEGVEHGEAGYGLRGAVNVPLSDTLAIRASGFTRRDPGYIDNIETGQSDVNRAEVYGGHLAALWRLSDTVSLRLGALLQHIDGDGSPATDTNALLQQTLGDLKQARMRGTEAYSTRSELYTATLTAKLGSLDFISVSGYGSNRYSGLEDSTPYYGSSLSSYFGVSGSAAPDSVRTNKITQEFRLSSASGRKVEWLAGAFYTHESTVLDQGLVAIDPTDGSRVGVLADYYYPTTVSEYALFGDITVHFTDRFDVQFGGRGSESRQVYDETDTGPTTEPFYGFPPPLINPTERTKGDAFTYLLTPRLKISPDLMIYARFTSGYRLGGNNVGAVLFHVPLRSDPDKSNNYELGVKGDLFEHALTFDVAAYYVAWKRIQITLLNEPAYFSYNANAGNAKSQGLELSLQARPAKGLTITGAASLNDAELTQDLPPSSTAFGSAGDRLPYSIRFSGSVGVEQEFALVGQWMGFVGGSLDYVGAREGEFASSQTVPRLRFPGYAQTDLRLGARSKSWTVNLFVNNVADRRGILSGYIPPVSDAVYIQPRAVGLSCAKTF